jgi:Flp pilus assembly protein TadD
MTAWRENAMGNAAALLIAGLVCAAFCPALAAWANSPASQDQTIGTSRKKVTDESASDAEKARQLLATGTAQLAKKDFQGAATTFQDYTDLMPDDAFGHFQLGYVYTGLGDAVHAEDEYREAIDIDPTMGPAFLNLGLTLLEKDPAGAVEALQQAAQLMPKDPRVELRLGDALERTGQTAGAIDAFREAIVREKNSPEAHAGLARGLLNTNDPAGAETEFRAALALQPDCAACRGGLIDSLVAQKKAGAAEVELRNFLQAHPGDPAAAFELARLLAQQDKSAEALEQLDRAAAAGPETLASLKLRASVLLQMEDYHGAAAAMEIAAAQSPRDAEIRASLGHVEMQRKDYPAAVRYLSEALTLEPLNLAALKDLLATEYIVKNYPVTLKLLGELENREPPTAGSWFIRGACYDKLAQKPEALAAYKKYLELNAGQANDAYFEASSRVRALEREIENKRK